MNSYLSALAREAISNLYDGCDEPRPSPDYRIVPLSKLLRSVPLTSHELPSLNARDAQNFLMKRGAIIHPTKDISEEPLAGFLYANEGGGSIFVRSEDPISRRRFSAAHELGHYLLHWPRVLEAGRLEGREGEMELIEALPPISAEDTSNPSQGKLEITDSASVTGLPPLEQMEREADVFAAELLMPEDVVRAVRDEFGRHWRDADLIWRLSNEMLVSRAAMGFRLSQLNLLREGVSSSN